MRIFFAAMEASCGWWNRPDDTRMGGGRTSLHAKVPFEGGTSRISQTSCQLQAGSESAWEIDFGTLLDECFSHLFHALLQGLLLVVPMSLGVLPHIIRDLHRAEVRPAHGAE